VSLKAIKGQVVADFLVDNLNIEIMECYIGIKPWILYFDGSKHVNGTRIGVVLIFPSNTPLDINFKIQPVFQQ